MAACPPLSVRPPSVHPPSLHPPYVGSLEEIALILWQTCPDEMGLVGAVWTGGSQPSSHLCFSLSPTAPLPFLCPPLSPLSASPPSFVCLASFLRSLSGQPLIRPQSPTMPGALHGIGDDDDGDDDDGGSNNWPHCDKSVEAVGGGGGGGRSGGGRAVLQFASLCIYLQLPDGAQQKERVLFFPPSSPLPPLGPGVLDHVPGSICSM